MNVITESAHVMQSWLASSPLFVFLLALPFMLVALGLAADAFESARRPSGRVHAG